MAKEKLRCGNCGALVRYEAKSVQGYAVTCDRCKHETPVEGRAIARFIRTAPRKLRLVADAIRGKSVNEALTLLRFTPKHAAGILRNVVLSARANAEHSYHMNPESLIISNVQIDGGPVLKRFMPRAMGRAASIRKRTSHITVRVRELSTVTGPSKRKRMQRTASSTPAPVAKKEKAMAQTAPKKGTRTRTKTKGTEET